MWKVIPASTSCIASVRPERLPAWRIVVAQSVQVGHACFQGLVFKCFAVFDAIQIRGNEAVTARKCLDFIQQRPLPFRGDGDFLIAPALCPARLEGNSIALVG